MNSQQLIDTKLLKYLIFLKKHLKKEITRNKKDCYVIGISCGIDSVLALRILLDILPASKIKAYFIDIESHEDRKYLNLIQNYFSKFELKIEVINLLNTYKAISYDFDIHNDVCNGNIKSKLRSMYLYSQAYLHNGLVLNTTNYDEYILGYFTKYGDSNGDVFLLNGLLKRHIKDLSKYYGLPKEIIDRNPTSGLGNKNDEDEFEFTYYQLDSVLLKEIKNKELEKKIKERIKNNEHKHIVLKNSLLKPLKKYKY